MENHSVSQSALKKGWKEFVGGQEPTVPIRPEVLEAWERCRGLAVTPFLKVPFRLTDADEIDRRLQRNQEMLQIAGPAIEYLYQFLQDANLFAAISDAEGYLLKIFGDTTLIDPNHDILYTVWSEDKMGNNPIGTSIHDDRPLQVSGYEHYCIFPHHFSGAGAPIHAPDGRIIGAISITHVTSNPHPHTLAMIVMTAYAIELQLRQLEASRATAMAYQHLQVVIDSLSESLLVLDRFGRISMVNGAFLQQLQVNDQELMGRGIQEFLFDPELIRSISQGRAFTDAITKLHVGDSAYPCVMTCRPVTVENKQECLLILSDLSRAHKLASKLKDRQARQTFDTIIGISQPFRRVLDEARRLAATDSNILLLGESGSGKDVLAQAIHNASSRRNGPFIPINCGAIQRELIQSELFGYEEGAFTGAKRGGAMGKLEAANGGTVFLDEIGEMPIDVQPILLRAIEQRMITRVGGKKFVPLDVRIIAATNKDLYQEMQSGHFRQDLFYRLNVFTIALPPLRERVEDIPALVNQFVRRMDEKYGKQVTAFTPQAMELLCRYPWPGNVRELQNCVERCVVLAGEPVMDAELLPATVAENLPGTAGGAEPLREPRRETLPQPPSDERAGEELLRLLEHFHWNITQVSQYLGVTRATVYRKMKRYHLEK